MDQIFTDLGVVQEEETETAEETEENNEVEVPDEAVPEAEAEAEAEGPGQTEEVEEEKPKKRVSYKAPKIDYEEIRRTVREEVSRQQPPAPEPAQARQAIRELEDEAPACSQFLNRQLSCVDWVFRRFKII